MSAAYQIPHLTSSSSPATEIAADLIVVPLAQGDGGARFNTFNDLTSGQLASALERGAFRAKPGELLTLPVPGSGAGAPRVLVVGMGSATDVTVNRGRQAASAAVIAARCQRFGRLVWAVDGRLAEPDALETAAEGFVVGNFDPGHYKTKADDRFFVSDIACTSGASGAAAALDSGRIIGEAVNGARKLINEPANHLPPRALAERAQALTNVPGLTSEVLDEAAIEGLGMGLLLGVSRGSAEPPRVLVLRYDPAGAPAGPVLGLVGKGVTFDTGGLSLKPADGMERMKDDMAGAATVVAAMRAIALLQPPIRVLAVVPMCENMPGGRATRPGDVLKGAAGITVEVNNTDAEGRLILGDGLWYARELGATHLVDVATLTGACIVALGKITTGLCAAPDQWGSAVQAAAGLAGERVWPLPIFEDYREALTSDIADLRNSPGRAAGAITAALFLKEFTGGVPWAHLDIAGPAWADETKPWTCKGATGTMIRTLVELARSGAAGWPAS